MVKVRCIVLTFTFLLLFNLLSIGNVSASTVIINGAIIENGRTLVPLRSIFEELGAKVDWDSKTKTVKATKDNTSISIILNSKNAKVNGKTVSIDVPAKTINGNTLVPLRFISESLGASVKWEEQNLSALIESNGKVIRVLVDKVVHNKSLNSIVYRDHSLGFLFMINEKTYKNIAIVKENNTWSDSTTIFYYKDRNTLKQNVEIGRIITSNVYYEDGWDIYLGKNEKNIFLLNLVGQSPYLMYLDDRTLDMNKDVSNHSDAWSNVMNDTINSFRILSY